MSDMTISLKKIFEAWYQMISTLFQQPINNFIWTGCFSSRITPRVRPNHRIPVDRSSVGPSSPGTFLTSSFAKQKCHVDNSEFKRRQKGRKKKRLIRPPKHGKQTTTQHESHACLLNTTVTTILYCSYLTTTRSTSVFPIFLATWVAL